MLVNLLSVLEKNADAVWLCGLLLALGFGRNRYALVLAALSVPMYAPSSTAGLSLASAGLVLLIVVLPEPPLRSLRSLGLVLAAAG